MFVMAIIVQSIALVIGSVAAAGLLCWLASAFTARLHHRGWAAMLLLGPLSILLLTGVIHSEFVRLSALCGLFGALFLWISERRPDEPTPIVRGQDK
ncbi:hypothetical protein [Sphingobium estronivorans]|uniref:hypothetical protein n=1 Tax=Sphingobium estronivorans TaxID=1577690 RepID=UPI00123B1158|nr:hypothetical protein [Sphingobium estronivorans]